MNLRQIEIFRAVMLAGSVSEAARFLNVSQPAVSRLLQHTEDQLGLRLFQRLKGRLHPTDEAHLLYAEVEKAYRGMKSVQDIAQDLAESRVGRLRLVCSPSLGLALVPRAVAKFRQGRDRLRIELEILPQAELCERVITHQADLGISMFSGDDPSLAAEPLCRGQVVCILPQAHPLADRAFVAPDDLSAFPLISYDRETPQGRVIDDAFTSAGVRREIAIEVRFGHTACALVQAGAGIALVDEFSIAGQTFPGVVALPFRPQRSFTLSILRNTLRPPSQLAENFAACLREMVAAWRPG